MSELDKGIHIGLGGIGGVAPSGAPSQGGKTPEVSGADFARILEELTAAAGRIDSQASSSQIEDPKALKDAVQDVKQSMDAVNSLAENLLESYRRALVEDPNKLSK